MRIFLKLPQTLKKAAGLFLVFVFVFSGIVTIANAAISPVAIYTYQGRILNSNGVPVSDASVDILFELYDASAAGTCLWSNSSATCATTTARTVTLTDGLFTEDLGDTSDSYAAISESVFKDNSAIYLQVTIEGEALTPRKRFTSVGYATNASALDGIESTGFFQLATDNVVTGANDFTGATFLGASALVFEGATVDAFKTTFAITDPTGSSKTITFKDESGTVAFLGDSGWTDNGVVVTTTTSTDDIAVGGATANASIFGVTPSSGTIYFGDGSANPTLTFKDSALGTADLSFANDAWTFSDGSISHTPTATFPLAVGENYLFDTTSTVSVAASGGAGRYKLFEFYSELKHSAVESVGYDHVGVGVGGYSINSDSGVVNSIRGVEGSATNTSIAATAIEAAMVGVYGEAVNNGLGSTAVSAIGIWGRAQGSLGTITTATGVRGEVNASAGTITLGLSGDFSAEAGTTRYGIRSTASGGTNNYAGYFYGSAVHIEDTNTPSAADYATSSGDLYIAEKLEVDGASVTDTNIVSIENSILTTGRALSIIRQNSVTDFTNITTGLAHFEIQDSASTGHVVHIGNEGTGHALAINQIGDNKALNVFAAGTTDYIASFINDGNADTNMGIAIQSCLDVNPTAVCNFMVFKDGDGDVLGAIEGDGAGGVTNASAGSDYAELFPGIYASFGQGDVISLDASSSVSLATSADQMIGAYSVAPNTLGNWFENWRSAGTHVPVALLGQVPVRVNMEGGAITAGDYLTISTTPGVAKKANGVGYVLGRALESHASGTGLIEVFIHPTWQALGSLTGTGSMTTVHTDLVINEIADADATTIGRDSYGLMLRGSGWDGASAQTVGMGFVTHVTDAASYKLSVETQAGDELALVNQDGDFAIAGRLYPSDRGTLQTGKYIYYDGSSGSGGDFMRTNASGWGSGSYDFAEMFPTQDIVAPGQVVIFGDNNESVKRSDGTLYDNRIAGIISTQPGFLAGQNKEGHMPVALAGRVPTYVSAENGSMAVGDPVTTSSKPGYAMKATQPGPIVGYAMESFDGTVGSIIVFVRPSYFDGSQPDLSDNTLTEKIPSSSLDLSGVVNLNGGTMISVESISGIGDIWQIDAHGSFVASGRFVQTVQSYGGEKVETYAVTASETTIQLSGTIELQEGRAHVYFDDYDEAFKNIIALQTPYRVFLTAYGPTGSLYAIHRENDGFIIRDTSGISNINVDWLVIAYHKDYAPEPERQQDVLAQPEDEEQENGDDVHEDPAETPNSHDSSPLEDEDDQSTTPVEEPEADDGDDVHEDPAETPNSHDSSPLEDEDDQSTTPVEEPEADDGDDVRDVEQEPIDDVFEQVPGDSELEDDSELQEAPQIETETHTAGRNSNRGLISFLYA